MLKEIESATSWWTSQLANSGLSSEQLLVFRSTFSKLLIIKYNNHWYLNEPLRGNGYRSIWFDVSNRQTDQLLLGAGKSAKIYDLEQRLANSLPKGSIMWVDPGEVSLKTFASTSIKKTVLYSDESFQLPEGEDLEKDKDRNDPVQRASNNQDSSIFNKIAKKNEIYPSPPASPAISPSHYTSNYSHHNNSSINNYTSLSAHQSSGPFSPQRSIVNNFQPQVVKFG